MLAEPAKIRHFPLAPVFRRLGARTAHPQGRSASEGRAALAERCAGGLPTENKARQGSRRRHVVRCWYCRTERQGPDWYCRKIRQWVSPDVAAAAPSQAAHKWRWRGHW
jgi:hypothetical protein